jgi:alpha-L-fucosidase
VHALVDRVSKNGTMVLNIAPMADGTIPAGQQSVLRGIGDYLRRFGESVYDTRAWTTFGEGPTPMGGGTFQTPSIGTAQDVRFTRSKDGRALYATFLGWPGPTATIATRIDLSAVGTVRLLGGTAGTYIDLPAPTQDGSGLHVALPSTAPYASPAYVLKLAGQVGKPTETGADRLVVVPSPSWPAQL